MILTMKLASRTEQTSKTWLTVLKDQIFFKKTPLCSEFKRKSEKWEAFDKTKNRIWKKWAEVAIGNIKFHSYDLVGH